MIRYLLDTNVLVDILRGKDKSARKRLLELGIDHCAISDISVYELYCGAAFSACRQKNLEILKKTFEHLAVIPASDGYWEAAKEKKRLEEAGTPIEDFDLLIGCTALSYGFTLVTDNLKHMRRIQGLKTEAWK